MAGVTAHGLGLYREAVSHYNIAQAQRSWCWYQKEAALFTQNQLGALFSTFNFDRSFDPYFKEAFCKRSEPSILHSRSPPYKPQPRLNRQLGDVQLSPVLTPAQLAATRLAKQYGARLQYNCRGYNPNLRQHRMAGLAILDAALQLRRYWAGEQTQVAAGVGSGDPAAHPFGWRDLFDILVRWRQLSEPNDPVWWVDLLAPEAFKEGFGSHTPMITGQTNVPRYYPFFETSFAYFKILMKHQLPEADPVLVDAATTVGDLWALVKHDFFVITPCVSVAHPGRVMEGTRLTIQKTEPEGWEYSIRTPGTPPRWAEFDEELTYIFENLTREVQAQPRDQVALCL